MFPLNEFLAMSHKQKLGLKITEGKREMSKSAYSALAKILFESEAKEDVFAHLFLILDWNLMKRAENCVDAKINHIYFQDDCLVFQFAKSKGHQQGEEHVGPWHVFSNPDEPHICPVLSLARYLFFVFCIVFSLIHLFLFHTLINTIFCLLLSIAVAHKVFVLFSGGDA